MAFRDAYQQVGRSLDRVAIPDHDGTVRARTHAGSTGNLGLPALADRLAAARRSWDARLAASDAMAQRLLEG
jgi:hypothetical protein